MTQKIPKLINKFDKNYEKQIFRLFWEIVYCEMAKAHMLHYQNFMLFSKIEFDIESSIFIFYP